MAVGLGQFYDNLQVYLLSPVPLNDTVWDMCCVKTQKVNVVQYDVLAQSLWLCCITC